MTHIRVSARERALVEFTSFLSGIVFVIAALTYIRSLRGGFPADNLTLFTALFAIILSMAFGGLVELLLHAILVAKSRGAGYVFWQAPKRSDVASWVYRTWDCRDVTCISFTDTPSKGYCLLGLTCCQEGELPLFEKKL